MNIQRIGDKYIIFRGRGDKTSYFSFYVDADKSSWSRYDQNAQRYPTVEAAKEAVAHLRDREALRRKANRHD